MESQIAEKKLSRGEKKIRIIDAYGKKKPTTIAREIGCRREYVYMVWKAVGFKVGLYKCPAR